ncbi:hypothetical protein BGZ63DRAFT_398828 [Mariannaea sp. PMI_226]|nr:hypothetical protein BGZ63DRAFT_398828 [Mariannaea sp. PMI_226]
MSSIDPRLVEAACMADLSRERQEELPLSNVAKKGPTYDPRGRNGTSHYSPQLKDHLNDRWQGEQKYSAAGKETSTLKLSLVEIVDEESRQTEGLRIEDARPWAAKVARHILESDAAKYGPQTKNGKPVQPSFDNGVHFRPAARATRPIEAQWGPPRAVPASNGKLNPASIPAFGPLSQTPIQSNPPLKQTNETSQDHIANKSTPIQHHETKENADAQSEHVLIRGECEVVPGQLEKAKFIVDFKMVVLLDKNDACIHFVSQKGGRGERVHGILDIEPPVIDGEFCKLKLRDKEYVYYLRLGTPSQTNKFKQYIEGLQQSVTAHLKGNTIPPTSHDGIATESPATGLSSPPQAASVAESPAVVDVEDGKLIDLNGFEQVQNLQIPTLHNAAGHIINLIDQVITHYHFEDHLIDSVVKGIEDGAIEYWVQQGFMSDFDDEIKEHLIAVLRSMAHIKIKMHLRYTKQAKDRVQDYEKEDASRYSAIFGTVSRLQYTPKDINALRSKAIIPNDWSATKGLPISAAAAARSIVRRTQVASQVKVGAEVKNASVEDVEMINASNGEVSETSTPKISCNATSVSNGAVSSTQSRPVNGLASSHWANSEPDLGMKTSHRAFSTSSITSGMPNSPETPATRSAQRSVSASGAGKSLQGLSSSRFASRPIAFHGNFTGGN